LERARPRLPQRRLLRTLCRQRPDRTRRPHPPRTGPRRRCSTALGGTEGGVMARVSDPDSAIKAYYAARAPYYDDVYDKPERPHHLAFLKQFLPSRFAGSSVIEVACGTGYWTQYIAPVASRFVAADAIAEPLEFARQRPGVERVEFVLADAYALPTELGKF